MMSERCGWEREWGFDPARRQLAASYSRIRYCWALARPILSLGPVALLALTGAARAWYGAVASGSGPAFTWGLTLSLGWMLWTAIWAYPSSYVPGRRYGLVTSSLRGWLRDRAVAGGLGLLVLVPAAALVGHLVTAYPSSWWWRWWLLWTGGTVFISYIFPVAVLPLFHRLTTLENGPLKDRLLRLAAKTGTRVDDIYVADLSRRTSAANAFVAGIGRTRRLALGDTLLARFTPGEIEAVLAHEIAHHRMGHVPLSVLRAVLTGGAVIWASARILPALAASHGYGWPAGPEILPLLVLLWMILSMLAGPAEAAMSRRQERQCDAYALRHASDPASFASAMVRLGDSNLADLDPPTVARLFLYTHPPIRERLNMAEGAGVQPSDARDRLARGLPARPVSGQETG